MPEYQVPILDTDMPEYLVPILGTYTDMPEYYQNIIIPTCQDIRYLY